MVRSQYGDQDVNFRVITLKEPPKNEMITFLEQEHRKLPVQWTPIRCARVEITLKATTGGNELHELHVDLAKNSIVKHQVLKGKHPYIDSVYMKEVETACMTDQRVQDEIRKLDLPPGASVVVEPWTYATDGQNDMSKRVTMVGALLLPTVTLVKLCASVGSISVCLGIGTRTTMLTRSTFAQRSLKN